LFSVRVKILNEVGVRGPILAARATGELEMQHIWFPDEFWSCFFLPPSPWMNPNYELIEKWNDLSVRLSINLFAPEER